MLRFDKATPFSSLHKTCGLEVLLFSEFINIVSLLHLY